LPKAAEAAEAVVLAGGPLAALAQPDRGLQAQGLLEAAADGVVSVHQPFQEATP
jgi:hypothetical protein